MSSRQGRMKGVREGICGCVRVWYDCVCMVSVLLHLYCAHLCSGKFMGCCENKSVITMACECVIGCSCVRVLLFQVRIDFPLPWLSL